MEKKITRELIEQLNEMEHQLQAYHGFRHLWAELVANREPCGLTREKLEESQMERLTCALALAYGVAKQLGLHWEKCEMTREEFRLRVDEIAKERGIR